MLRYGESVEAAKQVRNFVDDHVTVFSLFENARLHASYMLGGTSPYLQ